MLLFLNENIHVWYLVEVLLMINHIIMFVMTKTRLFKYIEYLTSKNWKFSDKNSDIFLFLLKT